MQQGGIFLLEDALLGREVEMSEPGGKCTALAK